MFGVEPVLLVAAVAIVLLGGTVSGITGFGFGLVVVPLLMLIFPPPVVVAVTKWLSLGSGAAILLSEYRAIDRGFLRGVVPTAYLGLGAGLLVLTRVDGDLIKLLAALVVISFALLAVTGRRIPGLRSRHAPGAVGGVSGFLNTSTGMSGPPVVLLLTEHGFAPAAFRATITAYFVSIDLPAIALLYGAGVAGRQELGIALALFPVAVIGRAVGRWLANAVDRDSFRRLTLGLLVLTGVVGVVTAGSAML